MVARRWVAAVVLLGALSSLGAQFQTRNFTVEAPTQQIAQRVGEWAEYYRKQKALQWLGREMPPWGQPCPLKVTVTYNGSGGATSFAFDRGRILSIDMHIEGTLDRLIASVLPHEVTHTVFAQHFRCPVPRWADEGGSVLSEDEQERRRHESLVRQIIRTPGRAIPLERLFALTQYPRDVMVLYAEGYSVTSFLVAKKDRAAFLAFVGDGMRRGWDTAVQAHYGYRSVRELEKAWLEHLRNPQQQQPATDTLASNGSAAGMARRGESLSVPASRVFERKTLPPALPLLSAPRPVVRGVSGGREGGVTQPLPVTTEHQAAPSSTATASEGKSPTRSAAVHLGTPRPLATAPSWDRPAGKPPFPPPPDRYER